MNKSKNTYILLHKDYLYFVALHLKLASPFYLNQLVDIFAYEINANTNPRPTSDLGTSKNSTTDIQNYFNQNLIKAQTTVTVYNFQSLQTCERSYLFTLNNYNNSKSQVMSSSSNLFSITELFPSANWLEREVSELHGVVFTGKQDLRNLLLPYGDSTAPFQKSFPTIGLNETYYDPIKDTLIQNAVTVQL